MRHLAYSSWSVSLKFIFHISRNAKCRNMKYKNSNKKNEIFFHYSLNEEFTRWRRGEKWIINRKIKFCARFLFENGRNLLDFYYRSFLGACGERIFVFSSALLYCRLRYLKCLRFYYISYCYCFELDFVWTQVGKLFCRKSLKWMWQSEDLEGTKTIENFFFPNNKIFMRCYFQN